MACARFLFINISNHTWFSFLGLVKFYLKDKPTLGEAKCLVQYLESVQDASQVIEILDLMNSLCTRSSANKLVKRLFLRDLFAVCVALLVGGGFLFDQHKNFRISRE